MLKIGVQTACILDPFGIDKGFEMIRDAGFDCVDFNIDHCLRGDKIRSGEVHGSFFDQTDDEIKAFFDPYIAAAKKYGISFSQAHAPFPSWLKGADETNDYMIKVFEKSLMICQYVGCPHLIVHPFFAPYSDMLTKQEEWDINIDRYSRLIPAAKKYGVTVCLENMFVGNRGKVYASVCQDTEETCRYIDTLNEMAGEKCFAFCLDVGHSLLASLDIYRVITGLGKRIETLHIHDNNGVSDQHLAPYMGILDWERFCKGLKEIGYEGELSFETFNALHVYPQELVPQVLNLISAAGHLFAKKISE